MFEEEDSFKLDFGQHELAQLITSDANRSPRWHSTPICISVDCGKRTGGIIRRWLFVSGAGSPPES